METQSILKPKTRLTFINNILYKVDSNNKILKYKSWLGDYFAFLYDRIMEKNVFPNKFDADIALHNKFWRQELGEFHYNKILEIGTGSGVAANWLHSSNEYHGIDISPGLLKKAVKKFRRSGFRNCNYYILESKNLIFYDNSFDLCLCILTMNFLTNLDKVLMEISRVLQDEGKFYGCVPVPEKNHLNTRINGNLLTENQLKEKFQKLGFKWHPYTIENGTLLYFKAVNFK
ncbi:MAG: class I SAM-dependent methyltransferase [Fidelibacterota bacterium]